MRSSLVTPVACWRRGAAAWCRSVRSAKAPRLRSKKGRDPPHLCCRGGRSHAGGGRDLRAVHREAVALARAAAGAGCAGLMVLPPYVYQGDWPEMRAHVSAVLDATPLSCILYNNPIAYGTDFVPDQVRMLCEQHANLHAVKESSGDIRRITAIRAMLGDRIAIFVGLDDAVLEGVAMGARGWVAGLVNALPDESVLLFEHAVAGRTAEARELYEWFLPLLRLDTVPKFVQLIKLVQDEVGLGNERVRAPRCVIAGAEREMVLAMVRERLANRKKQ